MTPFGSSVTGDPDARQGYLPTLDGWRAIAILSVMFFHATLLLWSEDGPFPSLRMYSYVSHGAAGVDVFFALSGFLITARLIEEQRRRKEISLSAFYIRRIFRILPPYFTYLLVIFLISLTGMIAVSTLEWASVLLFFRNYLPTQHGSWYLGHFWTLAVEEHFYLLWPALLIAFGRRHRALKTAAVALAVLAWRLFETNAGLVASALPGVEFLIRTDVRIDSLLWGCFTALLLWDAPDREKLRRFLSLPVWITLIAALIVNQIAQPPLSLFWRSLLLPVVIVGTMMHPKWLVSRFLETPLMRWIGRLSYSLYLWQQLFLVASADERPFPFGILQQLPVNIVCVFLCAAASYYVVERPMVKIGHRLSRRRTAARTNGV